MSRRSKHGGSVRKREREFAQKMRRLDDEREARERRQRRQQDHLREVAQAE